MEKSTSSVLPDLPVVSAVKGKEWPEGFKPRRDRVRLERTITVSDTTQVRAVMETEGGASNISVNAQNSRNRDAIPLKDVEATIVAMNILRDWVKAEHDRHFILPEPTPAQKVAVKPAGKPPGPIDDDDDEPEDEGDDEEFVKRDRTGGV